MSMKDVRRGNTQAEFNSTASGFLALEIIFIAIFCGFWSQSWWVFGLVFFGLFITSYIKKLAIVLSILLTIGWGVLLFMIGLKIGGFAAAIILSLIALFISGGLHIGALEYIDDLSYDGKE